MTPSVALRHSLVSEHGEGAPEGGETRVAFYEDECLELTVKPYGIFVSKIKKKGEGDLHKLLKN
jgi:hypothetical protein